MWKQFIQKEKKNNSNITALHYSWNACTDFKLDKHTRGLCLSRFFCCFLQQWQKAKKIIIYYTPSTTQSLLSTQSLSHKTNTEICLLLSYDETSASQSTHRPIITVHTFLATFFLKCAIFAQQLATYPIIEMQKSQD